MLDMASNEDIWYSTQKNYYERVTTSSVTNMSENYTVNDTWTRNTTDIPPSIIEVTQYKGASGIHSLSWDDATWILTSSFIIFTMQTGFGLIESGAVDSKNEVNIMVKNAMDVIFGGITYWMFGYGLSFGIDKGTNPFCGIGYWFVESTDPKMMGQIYSTFIFQLSFATTATTIVSGAMAERTHLRSYIVFSLINTVVYCIPAHWIWADNGFLHTLGVIDIAGSGAVHLLGAGSALVAAWMLGPRLGRYDDDNKKQGHIGNGTNTLIGMFMLWWGWLAFNSGSTFGISGGKWILAARTTVTTINGSIGGGISGIAYTLIKTKGKVLVPDLANSVLGSLVSITASCALVQPWESVVIGLVGGLMCCAFPLLMDKLHIDDPVGAVAVHGVGGLWGMLAAGLFVDIDTIEHLGGQSKGLFHGGGFRLLGVQTLACVCVLAWSMSLTFIMLFVIKMTMGLRLSPEEEALGSDLVEHGIGGDPNDVPTLAELLHMHAEPRKSTFFGFRRDSTDSVFKRSKASARRKKSEKIQEEDPEKGQSNGISPTSNGLSNGIINHKYGIDNGSMEL